MKKLVESQEWNYLWSQMILRHWTLVLPWMKVYTGFYFCIWHVLQTILINNLNRTIISWLLNTYKLFYFAIIEFCVMIIAALFLHQDLQTQQIHSLYSMERDLYGVSIANNNFQQIHIFILNVGQQKSPLGHGCGLKFCFHPSEAPVLKQQLITCQWCCIHSIPFM